MISAHDLYGTIRSLMSMGGDADDDDDDDGDGAPTVPMTTMSPPLALDEGRRRRAGTGSGATGAPPRRRLPAVPSRSYDLLAAPVPETRGCREGVIPIRWCRREDERGGIIGGGGF